ncbi:MAG: hypothetical protein J0L97_09340 [Alphaproteobacteria bacterium]|nr:hypothetical protein [Alphaproteobacteria bacterium]
MPLPEMLPGINAYSIAGIRPASQGNAGFTMSNINHNVLGRKIAISYIRLAQQRDELAARQAEYPTFGIVRDLNPDLRPSMTTLGGEIQEVMADVLAGTFPPGKDGYLNVLFAAMDDLCNRMAEFYIACGGTLEDVMAMRAQPSGGHKAIWKHVDAVDEDVLIEHYHVLSASLSTYSALVWQVHARLSEDRGNFYSISSKNMFHELDAIHANTIRELEEVGEAVKWRMYTNFFDNNPEVRDWFDEPPTTPNRFS